ncbi:hypothetical protein TNIN_302721 [Trichonephila inaurata madagascariensis]|uniref:Uncharacterized protein n=1 Tax=Trichonephila inaurata madagascariensis TaxID=2747483 RepID=A0A8X7BS96_9ARAC|nr:hypothetical protein TNIN_302721 [Trichonephila inaurata madagascariensis]
MPLWENVGRHLGMQMESGMGRSMRWHMRKRELRAQGSIVIIIRKLVVDVLSEESRVRILVTQKHFGEGSQSPDVGLVKRFGEWDTREILSFLSLSLCHDSSGPGEV